MKLGTQLVPPPADETDVSNKRYVDQLGGRGNADFIHAKLSTDFNITAGGLAVPFDTVLNSRELTIDGSGRVSGLKAGRTYLLEATIRITDVTGSSDFTWYDVTGAGNLGVFATCITVDLATINNDQSVARAIFTPSVDSQVELRTSSPTVGVDVENTTSSISVIELFGSPLHGGLEHLETIEVTGDAVQTIDFLNLNGDEDEYYVMLLDWIDGSAGAPVISLQPNSLTANQRTTTIVSDGTSASSGSSTVLDFANGTTRSHALWRGELSARTGAPRRGFANGLESNTTTGMLTLQNAWFWNDTSTNITSLRLNSDLAGGFGVGTRVSLYRLRAENGVIPTLDKANVYQAAQTVLKHDLGTASGAIAVDASLSNTFDLIVNGAATIGAPTNLEDGQSIVLRVRQDGTGSRAVTFNAVWDFGDDGAPDTSADAANSLMVVSGTSDGTNVFASAKKGFTNT